MICLGEALLDRLGPCGENPATAPLHKCDDKPGGAAANVACALARLGTPSALIGRLGADETGESFVKLLNRRGVGLEGLQRDKTRPTRVVLVRRQTDGERVFQGFAGDRGKGFSDQALNYKQINDCWGKLTAEAEWLLVGTIPLASSTSAESLLWCLNQSKTAGVRVALDVNWRPTFWDMSSEPNAGPDGRALRAMEPLIAAASLLKLTKEEALWLFGKDDPGAISAALPQAPDVVITNGGNPVHWHFAGTSGVLEVLTPAQIVDTTGAGDAFIAGLLHQLVQKTVWPMDYRQMIRFAAACGALVCCGAGAIDPQPDSDTIQMFLKD